MKQKKLRVGDKIRWNIPIGGNTIYTILDIDTTRPSNQHHFPQEVLFQWEVVGIPTQGWSHSYESLNNSLNTNKIIRLQSTMEPYKEIPTFNFKTHSLVDLSNNHQLIEISWP